MRKILSITTIALLLLQVSCKSGDSLTDVGDSNGESLTARIDGQNWSATFVEALTVDGVVAFTGTDGTRGVSIAFRAHGTGSYTVNVNSEVSLPLGDGSNAWLAIGDVGSGTITVNSINSSGASGSFSFVAASLAGSGQTGTRTIDQGKFNVKY